MDFLPTLSSFALPATLALLLTLLLMRWRQRGGRSVRAGNDRDGLDTVAAWPPEAARVMSSDERQAYDLLKRAAPGALILAQVPLSRFIRVPTRHSYGDWLQRAGSLSADLLVCDAASRVLAVIDIRAADESARSRRRHERLARVLKAAGVQVFTWRERDLPSVTQVRNTLGPLVAERAETKGTPSRPAPLIPVPEIHEILADGDRAAALGEPNLEPVPSGFFDDLEVAPAGARR